MIITKYIDLKVNPKNFLHLQELQYPNLKVGEIITIPIEHLMKGSKHNILVQCDICNNQKIISYKLYNYCIQKHNIYSCLGKCTNIKRDTTNIEKWGKKSWMQVSENYEEFKKQTLERTGYEHNFKNPLVVEKINNTILEKYGVTNISHSEEIYTKQQISGFSMKQHTETTLFYRGTYELDFIETYSKILTIEQGKRFTYFINDIKHYYFSDFYIPKYDLVIEIKSSYYWNKYLNINLLKMESAKEHNYIVIIDKNYNNFNKIITPV